MKRITQFALLILLIVTSVAQSAGLQGLRIWSAPDHSRLVFDLDGAIDHHLFGLESPDRIVIDLKQTELKNQLSTPKSSDLFIKSLRYAKRNGSDFRVVLDLKEKVKPKSFMLKPNEQYGHRLVVDLYGDTTNSAPDLKQTQVEKIRQGETELTISRSVVDNQRSSDIIVAIDAGHGGEDPGAMGPTGTREKDVVLQLAKKLAADINRQKGFKAVLTRTGDYYIGLRKRMMLARKQKADLFVSIHADAFHDRRVRGSSVYVLSSRGASSEASRWLADRENAADLVGGVKLEDKDDMLASVLLDLSQTATRQASADVAASVYTELRKQGKTHGKKVQKAGFMVLKSPDVPSMLIETAFISNPAEEKNLKNRHFQNRMAAAIRKGIVAYFEKTPPPGTWLAQQSATRHVTARGETLSEIAQQYSVSVSLLKTRNNLKSDTVRVGQVLTIPRS